SGDEVVDGGRTTLHNLITRPQGAHYRARSARITTSSLHRKYAVQPLRRIPDALPRRHVPHAHLGGEIVVVPSAAQLRHHRRVVGVALEQLAEALSGGDGALEVLDVHFLDALAQDRYPLLGVAVEDAVAHVEVG